MDASKAVFFAYNFKKIFALLQFLEISSRVGGFVVLSLDCLVEVLGVQTYAESSIWLLGINKAIYQLCHSGFWCDDALVDYLF